MHKAIDQVEIEGKAVLFESGIYAVLPADLPDTLSLAVLDVAGAAAQTARLVKPGDTVVVIGAGGKSGLLCLHEARKRAGITGRVIGVAPREASRRRAESTGYCDAVVTADATDALAVLEAVQDFPLPGFPQASLRLTRENAVIPASFVARNTSSQARR